MAQAAKELLKRAVELDAAQKYSEALICYEEGIQNLLRTMGECRSEVEQKELRRRAEDYLGRAEVLKQLVKEQQGPMERVHYVHIKAGDVGHSYQTLFQKCLDGNVEWVEVQDPYIRARHQVLNMVRFCELLVRSCKKLREIRLMTGAGESHGGEVSSLKELQDSLREHKVELAITYSSTLHDREVR